jgi:phosphoadenylyl-sulfate reductase (thioredoxin)
MLPSDIQQHLPQLERMSPEALIVWASQRFGASIVFATSLGAEDCVILDMIARQTLPIALATIDTGVLFRESYALWSRLEKRYGVEIAAMRTDLLRDSGPAPEIDRLWERAPDQCCHLRKIVPLRREPSGRAAGITGIRLEQSETRRNAQPVEWDAAFGLVKINPLVAWTNEQVWNYLRANDVPYNPLHDHGYPSIGCEPCTSPVGEGETGRSGRWRGRDKTECGLHVAPATFVSSAVDER